MKTNLGLSDEVRLEVGQILNQHLADEYVLDATTHDYHWNVTGPDFRSLHLLFESQHEQIDQWLDDVAERARAIGVGARGNWADLTKAARSSADAGIGLSSDHMLSELLALHEDLVVQLRSDAATSLRLGDTGTADFLTGLMRQHEKAAWLLRSHLETEEQETTS
jgi:starvation-inducible DNA-binding protein